MSHPCIASQSSSPQSIAASHAVDPDLPLANIRTMDQILTESLLGDRFIATLFGSFAAAALLLAAMGIYGVMLSAWPSGLMRLACGWPWARIKNRSWDWFCGRAFCWPPPD